MTVNGLNKEQIKNILKDYGVKDASCGFFKRFKDGIEEINHFCKITQCFQSVLIKEYIFVLNKAGVKIKNIPCYPFEYKEISKILYTIHDLIKILIEMNEKLETNHTVDEEIQKFFSKRFNFYPLIDDI